MSQQTCVHPLYIDLAVHVTLTTMILAPVSAAGDRVAWPCIYPSLSLGRPNKLVPIRNPTSLANEAI